MRTKPDVGGLVAGGGDVVARVHLGETFAHFVAAGQARRLWRGAAAAQRAAARAADAAGLRHVAQRHEATIQGAEGAGHQATPPRREAVRHTLQRAPLSAPRPAQKGQAVWAVSPARGVRKRIRLMDLKTRRGGISTVLRLLTVQNGEREICHGGDGRGGVSGQSGLPPRGSRPKWTAERRVRRPRGTFELKPPAKSSLKSK